jgi:hypothetical protein
MEGAMILYRIKDWNDHYENNRSRTVKDLQWVAIPNRHDGEGYSLVMAHERSSEIFTAFILMLQVASRCQPRGSLLRDNGRPHDATSLALKTRGRREWFEVAMGVLVSQEIGWIEAIELQDSAPASLTTDTTLQAACQSPDSHLTKKEGKEGMEGNGIPPGKKLSAADTVKFDGELKRVTNELKGRTPADASGPNTRKRIEQLIARQAELRKVLGVTA